jgi:hypothetical protein
MPEEALTDADRHHASVMPIPEVRPENELFELAVETRGGCRRFLLDSGAESVVSFLAVSAFQLQAAHVGARMAAMANDGAYSDTLRAVARDYGGVSSAALNLSVRCSVTAVDLYGAALGRLTSSDEGSGRELDGRSRVIYGRDAMPDPPLSPLIEAYMARVNDVMWRNTETLRDQVTHKLYKRGLYGSMSQPPNPAPLAFPQHIDIEHDKGGMVPLDQLSHDLVQFAEGTFRESCRILTELTD